MNSSDRQAPKSLIYLQKVDALCDQFEAGWIKGQPQSIESLLPDWPVADRMNLLKELIAIEFYHRSKRGEQVEPAEYVKRFPEMDPAWLLEELHKSNQVETNDDRQLETRNWAINSSPTPGTHSKLPAVPGYEILGELGRGAMGIVYLARQTALTRRVALKMVLAGREANAPRLEIEDVDCHRNTVPK